MKLPLVAFCASLLPLAVAAADDPFAPLATEARPQATRWQTDFTGSVELGVDYVTDDNFMFGRYNGKDEEEAQVYGNVDWRWVTDAGRWDLQGTDLGTDVGFARIQWDRENLSFYFELEGTRQVNNDSGRTPFRGDDDLTLPADWISSNVTSGFTNLNSALHGVDQELERDRYSFGLSSQLGKAWKLESSLQYEEKDGTQATGAAIFQDASAGNAAILPQPIDYESLEFDLSLNFKSKRLLLNGSLFYNDFDNNNDLLLWENPYDIFGPAVRYPNGTGGLGLAPDNEYLGGRLMGTWFIVPGWRFQVDGSYAETEQDQNYAGYTANENLSVPVPLPRNSLDGKIETSTLDTRLFYRPLPRLNLEFWWHGEQRESDQNRDGYQYVLGDGGNQSRSELTVYNTGHDYDINRTGVQGSYPLPWRSKLWLKYEYYKVERENSAVEETKEDRYSLKYRIPILANLHSRLELQYADRAASTYHWDQSYYALLDTQLINKTPDNQRYITHPLLAQYQLANRERSEAKLDMDWQPSADWSLALNVLWRDDEYDKSQLGLEEEEVTRVGGTVSWLPSQRLSITGYASYDDYQRDQNNREFRGGVEKNAFEIYPPLPQASDPSRNWHLSNEDEVTTVGFNLEWQLREDISLSADYSYVSTDSDYDFSDGGATDITSEPLPADDESDQHHLILQGTYNLRDNLAVKVDYQYWSYDSEDWAIHDLGPTSIDKVLTLGEQEADEDLHYIGTSIIYRWQ